MGGFPGILISLFVLLIIVMQMHYMRTYEFNLMKRIAHAKETFDNPADPANEQNYSNECEKFTLPCVYYSPLLLSGVSESVKIRRTAILDFILYTYTSYSITTLLSAYQANFQPIYVPLVSLHSSIPQILAMISQNSRPFLVSILVLSLYFDPTIRALRRFRFSYTFGILMFFASLINILERSIFLVDYAADAPSILKQHQLASFYEPVPDPVLLPMAVQKCVMIAEGKACDVSRWWREVGKQEDVNELAAMVLKDKGMPAFIKFLVRRSRSEDSLRRINQHQPVMYLGTVENRCVFLGRIEYDPYERVRKGYFYFDTVYIKQEFKFIIDKEMNRQRELVSKLPSSLEEILKIMEEKKN